MLGKRKLTVGLYIGLQKTVLAQLHRTGSSHTIEHLSIADTPSDAFNEDGTVNVPSVSRVVRDLLDETGIKSQEIALTIPARRGIIIRTLPLPAMSKKEMREALKSEIENYAPLATDEPVLDFQTSGTTFDATGQKTNVLLVAAPKKLVRSYTACVEAANMRLSAIEPLTLALLRTTLPTDGVVEGEQAIPSDSSVMIVGLEENDGTVAITNGRFVNFIHSVEFGRLQLEDTTVFEELANELKTSLTFYNATYPAREVEKVILFADSAESENICAKLSEYLNIPVTVPPLPETSDESTMKTLAANNLSAYAAIGTALFTRGEGVVNLIPTRAFEVGNVRQQVIGGALVVALVVFLSISATFAFKAITKSTKQKTTDTITERQGILRGATLGGVENEVTELRKQIDLVKTSLKSIKTIQWADVLPELGIIIPKTVWLNNFTCQENNLAISGVATTYDSVFMFMDTLKASSSFINPQINFIRKYQMGNTYALQFEIKCEVVSVQLDGQEVNLGTS